MVKHNLRNKMYQLLTIALLFSVTACQQGPGAAKTAFQAQASVELGKYVRGISNTYSAVAKRNSGRGVLNMPSANGIVWPTDVNMSTQSFPGIGQLYGGNLISIDIFEAKDDCDGMSEEDLVPVTVENWDIMIANFTRCLDRILVERNPNLTFANRNMGQYNLNQMGYLAGYGMPAAYDSWGNSQTNMLQKFLTQGYH